MELVQILLNLKKIKITVFLSISLHVFCVFSFKFFLPVFGSTALITRVIYHPLPLCAQGFSLLMVGYCHVVMCRFGGTEAATFCALTTLQKQIRRESSVDVYQICKLYHNKR